MKFKFGDRILVKTYITRRRRLEPLANGGFRTLIFWASLPLPNTSNGIFLRQVIIKDGFNDGEVTEDGGYEPYFKTTKNIKAAWVCIEGRKPGRVFLEDIELAETK